MTRPAFTEEFVIEHQRRLGKPVPFAANSRPSSDSTPKRREGQGQKQKPLKRLVAPKRGMNKLESAYEREILAIRKFAGEIEWYRFEGLRLKLADGAWFKPDFAVRVEGRLEFHECKGHMREAANVRLKVAAEMYPFKFYLCLRIKGQWEISLV